MTPNPITLPITATVADAARRMRDDDVGNVVVMEDCRIRGIVTDRDIVVRGVAAGRDPVQTSLAEICSRELTTVSPTDTIESAVSLMKDKAIRRLPVVDDGQAIGIVSIGDLAVDRDRGSALGEISAAPANR